jgi:hypothetical protein
MSKLPGVLGNYVTVGMAVEMLGHKRDQTGRFYVLVKKGLTTFKIGGMTLALASEFAELAGLPADSKPPWPAELASLPMATLYARNDAANRLGVSPRTINRYANEGQITAVDLSAWSGYTLYQLEASIKQPRYISVGDWKLELTVDEKERLHIVATNEQFDTEQLFLGLGVSSYSRKAFVYEGDMTPPIATFRVTEKLS